MTSAETSADIESVRLRRAIWADVWPQLTHRFPRRELRRIEGMFDIWIGKRSPRLANHQGHKMLFMPDLPTRPWLEPEDFPFTADFRNTFSVVQEEVRALLRQEVDLPLYGEALKMAQERLNPGWREFTFRMLNANHPANRRRCPETARLATRSLRAARFMAQFNLLILEPGAKLRPHVDPLNFLVTVQMGLLVPRGCALRVAGVTRSHEVGKILAFDNSFEHAAWNRGDGIRLILSTQTAHPGLTPIEVDALRFLSPVIFDMG